MTKKQEPKVTRIDRSSNTFMANGKKYFIQRDMCVARYVEYLKLQHEIAFGADLRGMYDALNKIYQATSHGNDILGALATVREASYNQLNAIVDFIHRDHPTILRFCALFCNREDENTKIWDERVVESKIEDWTIEGIEIDDFFWLAGMYNPTFREQLRESVKRTNVVVNKTPPRATDPAGSK